MDGITRSCTLDEKKSPEVRVDSFGGPQISSREVFMRMVLPANRRLSFVLLSLFLLLVAAGGLPQSRTRPTKNGVPKSAESWQDDKITVQAEEPYISKGGLLVLAYTLSNKSGKDLVIYREGEGEPSEILKGAEEVKLFRRLKTSGSYDEITKHDKSVALFRTFLPADVPVRLLVAFEIPKEKESWWSRKAELTTQDAIQRVLSDVDNLVMLIPSRRFRILLPVRP